MIRYLEIKNFAPKGVLAKMVGLSSDSKPLTGIVTGSEFREVDTGVVSYFDELSAGWYPTSNASKTAIAGATVTLGSALTYDGTEQTQAVSSVKIGSTTLTASTDYEVKNNKATYPGSYQLLIIGKGSYAGVLPVTFTVSKASGSVSADPDTLSLTEGDEPGTSTITVTGDGAVSVSTSDGDVATATLDDDTVTVTPVGAGSATITVTLDDGELYEGDTDTISVTVSAAESGGDGD